MGIGIEKRTTRAGPWTTALQTTALPRFRCLTIEPRIALRDSFDLNRRFVARTIATTRRDRRARCESFARTAPQVAAITLLIKSAIKTLTGGANSGPGGASAENVPRECHNQVRMTINAVATIMKAQRNPRSHERRGSRRWRNRGMRCALPPRMNSVARAADERTQGTIVSPRVCNHSMI